MSINTVPGNVLSYKLILHIFKVDFVFVCNIHDQHNIILLRETHHELFVYSNIAYVIT